MSSNDVCIQLFGQVSAWRARQRVDLGPPQRRAMLAVLALAAPRPVARHEVVAALWRDDPPTGAVSVIHTHVKNLRSAFEPDRTRRTGGGVLLRVGDGYRADLEPGRVDVLRFHGVVAAARAARGDGRHRDVVALAEKALRLSGAPMFADVPALAGHPAVQVVAGARRDAAVWLAEAALRTDTPDAVALQQRIVGDRVTDAPDDALRVARLCGNLPLAIRLAAARLMHRPGWTLRHLADRLAAGHGPIRELALPDRSVEAAFALSHQQLPPAARRMFRLLSVHPGGDFDAVTAAALADLDLAGAERLLAELVDAHLVREPQPGRYTMHDLLRDYAGLLTGDDRDSAVDRLLDLYLHTATAAAGLLSFDLGLPPGYVLDPTPRHLPRPETLQQAQAWFDRER